MLSAVAERVRRLWNQSDAGSDDRSTRTDDDPDLYECEECGTVFISEPEECSNCETDEFSNVGSF